MTGGVMGSVIEYACGAPYECQVGVTSIGANSDSSGPIHDHIWSASQDILQAILSKQLWDYTIFQGTMPPLSDQSWPKNSQMRYVWTPPGYHVGSAISQHSQYDHSGFARDPLLKLNPPQKMHGMVNSRDHTKVLLEHEHAMIVWLSILSNLHRRLRYNH